MNKSLWLLIPMLLAVSSNGQASTTVTVDNNDNVTVTQPVEYVPTAAAPVIVAKETDPKDLEGVIFRVDMSENQIMVLDTDGRERRITLKQGMIGTYKVDDYVRIHLMADLKEAKTIETIRGIRNLEGRIVSVDNPRSLVVVRGSNGKDSTVLVTQGQIQNFRVGDPVRLYLLENREDVRVIRVIR